MLARLRHRAVSSTHYEDRTVHLRGTRNHVFHIIRVAGAVNVRVMALGRFIFDMRDRNGHRLRFVTDSAAFGDVLVFNQGRHTFAVLHRNDGGGQGGFAVVNVTDGADVDVRFGSLKLLFGHVISCVAVFVFV